MLGRCAARYGAAMVRGRSSFRALTALTALAAGLFLRPASGDELGAPLAFTMRVDVGHRALVLEFRPERGR